MKAWLIFCIVMLAGLRLNLVAARPEELRKYREIRYVMGTLLDITLYHHDAKEARRLLDSSFSLAQRLDDLLSNYKAQSKVSRLNERSGEGKVRISPDLYEFLTLAKSSSKKTQGAFDITVGPLMHLWKSAYERRELPPSDSIQAAKLLVGAQHIVLRPNFEVEMTPKGVEIDTGGIGKGYAVDKIVKLFRDKKTPSALINFGNSSIYALGAPPQAPGWKLVLQFPGQTPLGILELKDEALSASDSLGSHFAIAGKTYGHIMEPKTGIPITARILAVVLSPSAADAEALGKYVVLRGWKKPEEVQAWGPVRIMRIDEDGAMQCSPDFPLISRIDALCLSR